MRSRRDSRSGGSANLAEVTQALQRTGDAEPYLAQMAYDMRHRPRDMHVLDEVDPPAGMDLAKEKLTRVSVCMFLCSTVLSLGFMRCYVTAGYIVDVCRKRAGGFLLAG